ncbi:MAG: CpsD/CapB family tyrosine-protein kinase [Pseudotabrizicola sp.]|uniref:CpsD/CapB family tyrosine-protein kinase n=1 Tax=Pseudotabrizicola sp. TaxID=2939647 RepID=UPI00271B2FDA|nr:CpsD/CapB family tyrosine-protein kinase [Pseudotabrizicola sp.]MDO9640857.1 CpsD/CapB family tyrosine-protein kinase [Pseudotabrizicola sp.]
MEKIQEALAKARVARADARADAPAVPARSEAQAVLEALQSGPEMAADAAWLALSPLSPDADVLKKARIMTLTGGQDAAPFDVMRTKVLQTMRANKWCRLAITSPTPGCGKSTITLNLGFSLSRQPDLRTIVTELDLRRPSLARTLGQKPVKSFAEVLQGQADFAEAALCFNHNLAFALTDAAVRNPAELLHGSGVQAILADIEARYAPDLMIFDMPPMLVSDDAMAFAGQVDCVLLVAEAETTTVKEIDTCERELATQTNVMGVVLNKCRFMGKEYGYSYYG